MPLPILSAPTFDLKLFSLPTPITFRPYLAKEEKILLMAQQSGDAKDVERAVKQILVNCTFGSVNVAQLPTFDIEYLYLQLRAKSVSNKVEIKFECKNPVDDSSAPDKLCHQLVPIEIDLDQIQVTVPEGHDRTIWLTENLGVTLRYPSGEFQAQLEERAAGDVLSVIATCLETVFEKDGTVHEISEQNPTEVMAFVESLTVAHLDKIRRFFDTMPEVTHSFPFVCPKCGYTETLTLRGLLDFFE